MATKPESSTRRRRERLPSFYKVLIGDFANELRIPPKFMKHLDRIPSHTFELWNFDKCWSVCIEKDKNFLYFRKGWKEFVKDNALKFGDFLVFLYNGVLEFDVTVYGKHGCAMDEDVVIENEMTNEPSCTEGNRDETEPDGNDQQVDIGVETIDLDDDSDVEDETKLSSGSHYQQPLPRQNTSKNKCSALEAAEKFVSKYPFFRIQMQTAYVQNGFLNLPRRYLVQHVRKKQRVTLRFSKKTWPVKLTTTRTHMKLCQGWGPFAKSNSLKKGDICIFELVDSNAVELRVSIFRA